MFNSENTSERYVLLMLLQRLEAIHPGLLDDLLTGVFTDRAATEASGAMNEATKQVFNDATILLERAKST